MQVFSSYQSQVRLDQQSIGRGRREASRNTENSALSAAAIKEKLSESKVSYLSDDPAFKVDKSVQEFQDLTLYFMSRFAEMVDMFRSAMDFFRTTGSFAGFMDTAAANVSRQLSLRDMDVLSRELFDSGSFLD